MFGCTIQTVYGASDGGVPVMTRIERSAREAVHDRRAYPARPPSCASPAPDMPALPAGEVGEVLWRNPTKTLGYLNDAERTDAMFWDDGFYRSGDLGVVDEDGLPAHRGPGQGRDHPGRAEHQPSGDRGA